MGTAPIVEASSGRFAAGWGLQQLWRHLAAGLQWDWIAVIKVPPYRQVCSRMGTAAIVEPSSGRFAAGLDWSNCGAP